MMHDMPRKVCLSGSDSVEVGFRIRLWDTREQRWRYDRAFVYTEINPEKRIPPRSSL
jgi:hypothetical protein